MVVGCGYKSSCSKIDEIRYIFDSYAKTEFNDYIIVDNVNAKDYLYIVDHLKYHGFETWTRLDSSEGFVLFVGDDVVYSGGSDVRIEYSVIDGVYPRRTVVLYIPSFSRLLIANASGLGG